MILKSIIVGAVEANCYLFGDEQTREVAIIDPGADAEKIKKCLKQNNYLARFIINTHGHIDHIGANDRFNLPIFIHKDDASFLDNPEKNLSLWMGNSYRSPAASRLLKDGDKIKIGYLILEVIHTPGHTPGGICLRCENILFSGDTIFCGGIGRTDMPGGSEAVLLKSIKEKLFSIDEEITIYPGHGQPSNEGWHRNWAYSQANNGWILSLDADERITKEVKKEICQRLKENSEFSAFAIPRKNFLGDYWMKFGGEYPAAQLKLFKKKFFRFEEVEVHPRAFLQGKCGHLQNPLLHYTYKNFSDFLVKLDSQTTLEAKKWIKTNRKMSFRHALWRTIDRFFRKYFRKKGYRDGFIGFILAIFAGFYQIISYAKYWEMKRALADGLLRNKNESCDKK